MKLFNDILKKIDASDDYEALSNALAVVMNTNGRKVTADDVKRRWNNPLAYMEATTYPNVCKAIEEEISLNLELCLKVTRSDNSIELDDAVIASLTKSGIVDVEMETERLLSGKVTLMGFRKGSANYKRFMTEERPKLLEKAAENAILQARRTLQMINSRYEREIDSDVTREWVRKRHYYLEVSKDLAAIAVNPALAEGFKEVAEGYANRLTALERRFVSATKTLNDHIAYCQKVLRLGLTV